VLIKYLSGPHKVPRHLPGYVIFFLGLGLVPPLLRVDPPSGEAPHPAYAPIWLFTALTDSGFGLPHPAGMEIFTIGDVTELDPLLFIVYAGLGLGAEAASAVRQVDRGDVRGAVGSSNALAQPARRSTRCCCSTATARHDEQSTESEGAR
jgi:hypothetical protein